MYPQNRIHRKEFGSIAFFVLSIKIEIFIQIFWKGIFHSQYRNHGKSDTIVLSQIYRLQVGNYQSQSICLLVWEKQKAFFDAATPLSGEVHVLYNVNR